MTRSPIRELLFTLLLKVGVASSIAALLARWNTSARPLHRNNAIRPETEADAVMTPPLIVGVTLRLAFRPTVSPIFLSKAHS